MTARTNSYKGIKKQQINLGENLSTCSTVKYVLLYSEKKGLVSAKIFYNLVDSLR